ncbi:c-type cytochrome [Dyella sedimenti]|uniref:c-type cytochrome n=1 Tax=Dyella sedimenti TaxID=2919947 RepID=UPI001FAB2724|nr:c-type cytochrome [Dyella sedimenti]
MKVRYPGGPLAIVAAALLAACGSGQQGAPQAEPSSAPAAAAQPAPTPAADAPAAAAAAPSPGEKVYQGTCVMCHGSPAVGAPVIGNKADWAPRIAQGKDVLYAHALQGFTGEKGAMPAHGGNPSLSDDQVKSAVDYMVSRAQ